MQVVEPGVDSEPVDQVVGGLQPPAEHLVSQCWPVGAKIGAIGASLRERVASWQNFPAIGQLEANERERDVVCANSSALRGVKDVAWPAEVNGGGEGPYLATDELGVSPQLRPPCCRDVVQSSVLVTAIVVLKLKGDSRGSVDPL